MGGQLAAGIGNLLFAVVLARVLPTRRVRRRGRVPRPVRAAPRAGRRRSARPARSRRTASPGCGRASPRRRSRSASPSSPPAAGSATSSASDRPRPRPRRRRAGRRRCSACTAASPTAASSTAASPPASSPSPRCASPSASPWRCRSGRSARPPAPCSPATPALAVCAHRRAVGRGGRRSGGRTAAPSPAGALAVGLSFVPMAVLQSTDLLVANRVLDADDAAALRRALDARRGRLLRHGDDPARPDAGGRAGPAARRPTAVALTAAVGLGVAAVGALLAPLLLPRAFGAEYADVRPPRRPVPPGDGPARRRARAARPPRGDERRAAVARSPPSSPRSPPR